MDERERILREMEAADAIRASSQERIGGVVNAIRSDIYDKLIHHAWFGQYPQQYADDLYRYADKAQDAAMPEVEAPAQEAEQESSMEAFYGAREQEEGEPQQYANDSHRHGDKAADATGVLTQEASMKDFYGAPEQEAREQEPPAYEREMER